MTNDKKLERQRRQREKEKAKLARQAERKREAAQKKRLRDLEKAKKKQQAETEKRKRQAEAGRKKRLEKERKAREKAQKEALKKKEDAERKRQRDAEKKKRDAAAAAAKRRADEKARKEREAAEAAARKKAEEEKRRQMVADRLVAGGKGKVPLKDRISTVTPAPSPAPSPSQLQRPATPVLMLPVRLETRFERLSRAAGDFRMRLRIYPDDISVDAHDPRLTAAEAEQGAVFWKEVGVKAKEPERLAYWRGLVAQFGARRALHILQTTEQGEPNKFRSADDLAPAVARMLPQKWIIRGYIGGFEVCEVSSNSVRRNLVCTPDPSFFDGETIDPASPIGWMVDFAKAVDVGMAIECDLKHVLQTGPTFRDITHFRGFDQLIVYGVPHKNADSTALLEQLSAKSASDGAWFVPQGTPTNNSGEFQSGWTEREDDPDRLLARAYPKLAPSIQAVASLAGTLSGPAQTTSKGTKFTQWDNDRRTKKALGIDSGQFLRSWDHSEGQEDRTQQLMNTLVWPIGWGRYFNTMLRGEQRHTMNSSDIDWLRTFFINDMRGGASLPTIGLGDNPYGLALAAPDIEKLPVDTRETKLIELMKRIRPRWHIAGGNIPRLSDGAQDGDPATILAELLARSSDPGSFTLRELFNREWGLNAVYDILSYAFFNVNEHTLRVDAVLPIIPNEDTAKPAQVASGRAQINVYRAVMRKLAPFDLRRKATNAGGGIRRGSVVLSDGNRLLDNRPNLNDRKTLFAKTDGMPPVSLPLGVPYPQSLLDIYKTMFTSIAEVMILCEKIIAHIEEHLERNEVFDIADAPTSLFKGAMGAGDNDPMIAFSLYGAEETKRDWPVEDLVRVTKGNQTISHGDYLPFLADLARSKRSKTQVPAYPFAGTQKLPLAYHLLRESVDIAAHNLAIAKGARVRVVQRQMDDVILALDSFVSQDEGAFELALRQSLGLCGLRLDAVATGLMRRRLDQIRSQNTTGLKVGAFGYLEDVAPREVGGDARVDESFIHAPSITHAKTAAILRAGWRARGSTNDQHAPLAVDLSSHRMKWARWCMSALSEGADLGDLLGARCERLLADRGLQVLIDPLRRAVIKLSGHDPDPTNPVVDGLNLLALWNGGKGLGTISRAMEFADKTKPARPQRIKAAVEEVDSILDAIADSSLADSVHALVQGNPVKAGASLAAIADGSAGPSKLEVLDTPGQGAVITQTVSIVSSSGKVSGWPAKSGFALRASIDPEGENLARQLLGDPKTCELGSTGEDEVFRFTLADLLTLDGETRCALDIMSMLNSGDGRSEFHRLADRFCAAQTDGTGHASLDRDDPGLLRLEQWQDVFANSRSLLDSDFPTEFSAFEEAQTGLIEKAQLAAVDGFSDRLASAFTQWEERLRTLAALLPAPTEEKPHPIDPILDQSTLRDALADLAQFDQWPLSHLDPDEKNERLQRRCWAQLDAMRKRLGDAHAALSKASVEEETGPKWRATREAAKLSFGKSLKLVSRVSPEVWQQATRPLQAGHHMLEKSDMSPLGWITDMGKIKPSLRMLGDAMMVSEALGHERLAASLSQTPEEQGQGWLASSAPVDARAAYSHLLLSLSDASALAASGRKGMSGLLVERVVERVPVAQRDTAVALEIETPNSEPPQAMVLAIDPAGGNWDKEKAFSSLLNLFLWVKARPVDSADLPDFDQHMSAIFADSTTYDHAERYETNGK